VMLGDGRSYHAQAISLLRDTRAATPWIIEHGYLRPGLILVEHWGTGGKSDARRRFLALPGVAQPNLPVAAFPSSFFRYALLDIGFHLSNLLVGRLTHPTYQHHALDGPVREYFGWALKGLRYPVRHRRTAQNLARIAAHKGKLFLFPLQLATDYQIRLQGTGASLQSTLRNIIESFARAAPDDALLIVKEHPLDNGLFDWNHFVREQATQLGIVDRVVFITGGDLNALLLRSQGVITVNSTVGLSAIKLGTPCRVLGSAVYDLPGLVDPQPLDGFWRSPQAPDPDLRDRFVSFLRHDVHVEGGFDGAAAVTGAQNLASWLAERKDRACA
jgi:capsular polysaccharide export protein